MNKKKIVLYDWIRLWATLFVVIGHSNYRTSDIYGLYAVPENISSVIYGPIISLLGTASNWVYEFHMPLFFLLSGAVLAIKPIGDLKKFITGKVKRLVIPYYLYGLLYMIPVKMAVGYFQDYSYFDIAKLYIVGQHSGHLWFLPALFWCMLVFVLAKKLLEKIHLDNGFVLFILSLPAVKYCHTISWDYLCFRQGLSYLAWFAAGYNFELIRKKATSKPEFFGACASAAVFVSVAAAEVYFHRTGQTGPLILGIAGVVLTMAASALCDVLIDVTKIKGWELIIRNLMNIYLFHDPLEYVILKYVFSNRHILSTGIGCYIYLGMRTIGVIIVSIIIGEIIRYITIKLNNLKKGGLRESEYHV